MTSPNFQEKLLDLLLKVRNRGLVETPITRTEIESTDLMSPDEAQAAINELLKLSMPKPKRYIRGENPFAVENKSGWNSCRHKLLGAFGLDEGREK